MGEKAIEVLKKIEKNKTKSIMLPDESWRWDTILEQKADESKSESEEAEEGWFENWLD
ncbi:MAG TPA: hypothetical protein VEF35_04195 [Candidatus Bathyarchaeia archaeon]|nr:hypothetical protein [Candidatus Bathyarchaeia archaeon]